MKIFCALRSARVELFQRTLRVRLQRAARSICKTTTTLQGRRERRAILSNRSTALALKSGFLEEQQRSVVSFSHLGSRCQNIWWGRYVLYGLFTRVTYDPKSREWATRFKNAKRQIANWRLWRLARTRRGKGYFRVIHVVLRLKHWTEIKRQTRPAVTNGRVISRQK